MQLAKESLMEPLDMLSLRAALRAGRVLTPEQALRVELHERVNALGIGAQGLGSARCWTSSSGPIPRTPPPSRSL